MSAMISAAYMVAAFLPVHGRFLRIGHTCRFIGLLQCGIPGLESVSKVMRGVPVVGRGA